MAGIRQRSLQLDQERLETDAQLQGRLAVAAGVEVGAGAEEEGLAGVGLLAAAEDGRHSFLRAQLFFAASPARGAGGDVDLAGIAEAACGRLFAAAETDQDPLRPLGGKLGAGGGVGAGERLRVQGAVEQLQGFVDQDLDRVLGLRGFVKPACRFLFGLEAGEGADRGDSRQRQRRCLLLGLARPAAPPAAGRRRADLLQDEDALRGLRVEPANQVAAVGQRQRSSEVELDEPEQGQSPPAEMPPLVRSGTAYFEGWTGTSGFSISPRRLIRRLHWSGFSRAAKRASIEPAVGW